VLQIIRGTFRAVANGFVELNQVHLKGSNTAGP
jgi:hypothetical protein